MDWAEIHYPQFFPSRQTNQFFAPYTYRLYPELGNAVGVADGMVYILGPVAGSNEVPVAVGRIEEFGQHVFARQQAFSDSQAARFLNQATLGATDGDIAAVRSQGFGPWLNAQMAAPPATSNWAWLMSKGYDTLANAQNSAVGADNQIWQALISAPDSLRQHATLAWSQILVVGLDGLNGNYRQFRLAAYWDLLAQHAFGNFRTLLEAVTLSPAMGNYLNMAGNQKANATTGRVPDENYAREVMQLFTIGLVALNPDGTPQRDAQGEPLDSYNETDVSQLARVFTGWNTDRGPFTTLVDTQRNPMLLNANLHETGSSRVLGTTIPANIDGTLALKQALDILFNHPNVGPFIGRQLIQRTVTSNPSPGYVARVTAAFNNNGQGVRGDLAAVWRAVLLDDEARAPDSLANPAFGKLREPLQRMLQWARTFKAKSTSGDWTLGNLSDPATRLGQSPQRSPTVFNFFRPGYVPPQTVIANAGLVAPEMQIATETSVAGFLNYMQSLTSSRVTELKADYTTELAMAADATALVARVERLLSADQLAADARALIVNAVSSIAMTSTNPTTLAAAAANRVATAVLLVLASPDYLHQK